VQLAREVDLYGHGRRVGEPVVVRRVVARPAVDERIRDPVDRVEQVVGVAARERVGARPADERVVAVAAVQRVVGAEAQSWSTPA